MNGTEFVDQHGIVLQSARVPIVSRPEHRGLLRSTDAAKDEVDLSAARRWAP